MLISLNWLGNFAKIPKTILPEELGRLLTMHTVEIDSITSQADTLANFVVGKITKIQKHPNADKLNLAKVDIKNEILDIVCGAPNIQVEQFVPVALVGAKMPNGFEIKAAKIRGEKSQGMLCSSKELGLGGDHSGIMILDNGSIGQNLAENLGLNDVIYEIDNKSITNRPDLWGHLGIAREVNAFLNCGMVTQKTNFEIKKVKTKIKVTNKEPKLCKRYMAISLNNIKVEPSPNWLQTKLKAVGLNPISNIVDVTNYVMLDIGQPLHAFDSTCIEKEIIIRKAKEQETIKTLDNAIRKLNKNTLIIADATKPLAIAGIIGGAKSEIKQDTTSITIECANFDPALIRKQSQILGVRTDSSMRFEKNLDPNLCETAIKKTVKLIQKICPNATISSQLTDIKNYSNKNNIIDLDLKWINKKLGINLNNKKIISILDILGFKTTLPKLDKIKVTVPTWRSTDITIPEDLLEEIARIIGYDNILAQMPKTAIKKPIINKLLVLENKIRHILTSTPSLTEVMNYSFVDSAQLQKLGNNAKNDISLLNPSASNQTKLRQSLVPNLLNNIKINQSNYETINIFEIGNIYKKIEGQINKDSKNKIKLPYQEKDIAIVLTSKNNKEDIFSKAKGIVEYLLNSLNIKEKEWSKLDKKPQWSNGNTCANLNNGLGSIAKLDTKKAQQLGIKTNVVIAEIKLNKLLLLTQKYSTVRYQEQSKYPQLTRDLAFVVSQEILYNDIKNEIINFNKLIKKIELFDVYEGESLGNKKSLAFHITYETNKTLTNEEVDKIQNKLIKNLSNKFNAKIRNF